MRIFDDILEKIEKRGALYWVLVDPDEIETGQIPDYIKHLTDCDIDHLLVGGSLLINYDFHERTRLIKENSKVPVLLFPGSLNQLTPHVDALLFLSIISGRNPDYLIGDQVIASPLISQMKLETIATGYMLIESGRTTTAEFMSNTRAIPSHKSEIAVAHALAAQFMGMQTVYLEAGSGADSPVPDEMIAAVASAVKIPVIAGGGIRAPETARKKVQAGAKIIVTGNVIEETRDFDLVREFASVVHHKK